MYNKNYNIKVKKISLKKKIVNTLNVKCTEKNFAIINQMQKK